MAQSLITARVFYERLGFDTLPLLGGTKRPFSRAWPRRSPAQMWHEAPTDSNIGIRGAGTASLGIIDCDERRTFENVTTWLSGLGYGAGSYPVVHTASEEGRHIYLTLNERLYGDVRRFSQRVGAGEFRYGAGAYVVAPPSVVQGGAQYTLISGDFSIRPRISSEDIVPLLGNGTAPLPHQPQLPRGARELMCGRGIERFPSRSEAEESIIASLINSGFNFSTILGLFDRYPCAGKYKELRNASPAKAQRWLLHSYAKAAEWARTHESEERMAAEIALEWARSGRWNSRTGAVDRAVYIAHARIAHRSGRLKYAASCRDLAELSGVAFGTAMRATHRLHDAGLLIIKQEAVADLANVYQLAIVGNRTHSPNPPCVRGCASLCSHDAFRRAGLGKAAAQIWQMLGDSPGTAMQLASRTGRNPQTVRESLRRMSKLTDPESGESLALVRTDDGRTYHAVEVDLDRVARVLGTSGSADRQRQQHLRDRLAHSRALRDRHRKNEKKP